jgi:hypothetical protein
MGNVLDKSCRQNQNTHFIFSKFFFQKLHRLRDNSEKYSGDRGDTNDVTIWHMRVACWIKRLHTPMRMHTPTCPGTYMHARTHARTDQYVTHCFSTATMIRERASLLRYTSCLYLLQRDQITTLIRFTLYEIEYC